MRGLEKAVWSVVLIFIVTLGVIPVTASALSSHAPIFVDGNEDFTAANGVTAGSGTASEPYVIEGWDIHASGGVGIIVRDTDAHFIVRNVHVYDGELGMFLERVVNGRVENSSLTRNNDGRYFPGAGIVITAGGTVITGSSHIVVSGNNISNNSDGILVHASSDVLLSGNTISSNIHPGDVEDSFEGYGVFVSASTDVNISSNRISLNGFWGILSHSSTNLTISSNQIEGNGFGVLVGGRVNPSGLLLVNLVFTNNNVSSNRSEGIDTLDVSRAELSGNTLISNGKNGMTVAFSSRVVVTRNNFSSNNEAGLRLHTSDDTIVSRNIFTGDGIGLTYGGDYTITPDNFLNGKPIYYHQNCYNLDIDGVPMGQLIVSNCRNVRVSRLSITNARFGISFRLVNSAEILDSDIAYSDFGISVGGSNITIRGNSLYSNGVGMSLGGSSITVLDNVLSSNLRGIRTGATDLMIANNRIVNNGYGLLLEGNIYPRGNITIKENELLNNSVGIRFDSMAQKLRVYHNNLVGNVVQALDFAYQSSMTDYQWDNNYPSGGNYWSDYTGVDNCSGVNQDVCPNPDGIGDTPYAIPDSPGSRDRYPLKTPFTTITGTLDMNPNRINLRSSGRYLHAYLEFSGAFDLSNLDQSSIRLNGVLVPCLTRFGDYNRNGITDLYLRFNLEDVKALLSTPGRYILQITGKTIVGERPLTSSDTVLLLGFRGHIHGVNLAGDAA